MTDQFVARLANGEHAVGYTLGDERLASFAYSAASPTPTIALETEHSGDEASLAFALLGVFGITPLVAQARYTCARCSVDGLPPVGGWTAIPRRHALGAKLGCLIEVVDTPFGDGDFEVACVGGRTSARWRAPGTPRERGRLRCDYVDLLDLLVGDIEVRDLLIRGVCTASIAEMSYLTWIFEADEVCSWWRARSEVVDTLRGWSSRTSSDDAHHALVEARRSLKARSAASDVASAR